jgi:hypothetical protein
VGAGVTDTATGLVWQPMTGSMQRLSAAVDYCADAGWRLPTLIELESIVDYTRSNPAIDTSVFPATPSVRFWTATPLLVPSGNQWTVDFTNGQTGGLSATTSSYWVRCVR